MITDAEYDLLADKLTVALNTYTFSRIEMFNHHIRVNVHQQLVFVLVCTWAHSMLLLTVPAVLQLQG